MLSLGIASRISRLLDLAEYELRILSEHRGPLLENVQLRQQLVSDRSVVLLYRIDL